MAQLPRLQRVRDPVHGLIEFRANEFESILWRALQTRPFQRLRRVKQLGFSELVYPGATHTRFAHSVGTFHVGRRLMEVIERHKGGGVEETRVKHVLASTLFHDIGHGPFSHAFEDVGRRLKLKMADHEHTSELLIRNSEVSEAIRPLGSGFANDVADIIKRSHSSGPGNMYEAVVSSQFDADRLDYMQRDRLMTGTRHGAIDFAWLLANLEVGSVPQGVDDAEAPLEPVETFVLGPKAVAAAETYVLGLFQLYETVYFHKTTRGAEKLFTQLLLRVFSHVQDSRVDVTGLPPAHPLVQFARRPEDVEVYLSLDDSTVWGALGMLTEATDDIVADLAKRLRDRKLYQCLDVRRLLEEERPEGEADESDLQKRCVEVVSRLKSWLDHNATEAHKLLIDDQASRPLYKQFQESKGPLNQIQIKSPLNGKLVDLGLRSSIIRSTAPLHFRRVYFPKNDIRILGVIKGIAREVANA
jgi:uncharacterized protein